VVASGQFQAVAIAGLDQAARNREEFQAEGLEGLGPVSQRQAQPAKVVDQIEGEEQELEEGHVGDPVGRGDLGQRVVGKQLADVPFDPGPLRVEAPDAPGMRPEVRDEDVVAYRWSLKRVSCFASTGSVGMGRRTTTHRRARGQVPAW